MRQLDITPGATLEDAVKMLIECDVNNDPAYIIFNDITLESAGITMDDAYKKVTGHTYGEHLDIKYRRHYEFKKFDKEHQDAIPRLTEEYIEKGHTILQKKYWYKWDSIVPVRLSDLYHGMELGNCLDIIKALNDGKDLAEAKAIIDKQDHSGMSFGLVASMVDAFCDRGREFMEYVYN